MGPSAVWESLTLANQPVADKPGMDCRALVPLIRENDSEGSLMAALLEGLQRMVVAGHRPSAFLLARLTDGRVKLFATPEGSDQARERTVRLRNECGPLEQAFHVAVAYERESLELVVENLCGGGPRRVAQRWDRRAAAWRALEPPRWADADPAHASAPANHYGDECRGLFNNSAILAASLGMTTGWLPKVETSLAPSGADNFPV